MNTLLNKWREVLSSWTVKLEIVKTSVLPNLIDRFGVIPNELPAGCFEGGEGS